MKDKHAMEFNEHEIEWNQELAKRIWLYYSRSQSHRNSYFGKRCGEEVGQILKSSILRDSSRILDFSCGRGDLLKAISPILRSDQVFYGCDFSEDSVLEARKVLENLQGFGAVYTSGELAALEGVEFDLILLTEVIEHLDDNELGEVLKTLKQFLKPGGYLFITTPFEENLEKEKTLCPECGCIFHRWQHRRSWTKASLVALMESDGYETVTAKSHTWGAFYVKLAAKFFGMAPDGLLYIGKR